MITRSKADRLLARRRRIRGRFKREQVANRLHVHRSGMHFYAQLTDEETGTTLVQVSTLQQAIKDKLGGKVGCNKASAAAVGAEIARLSKEKGIATAVFDRSGYRHHGVIEAFTEAVRKAEFQI